MSDQPYFNLDPDEDLEFKIDFAALTNGTGDADYLEAGETLVSQTTTTSADITDDGGTITDSGTSVTIWLDSPVTLGEEYEIKVEALTSAGRTVVRRIYVTIAEK